MPEMTFITTVSTYNENISDATLRMHERVHSISQLFGGGHWPSSVFPKCYFSPVGGEMKNKDN